MSTVQDVKDFLTSKWAQPDEPTEETQPVSTKLYHCNGCSTTYVSGSEKETCRTCDGPVENVPSERDLGIV
ncbi:hypothetical protein ACKVMT_02920 [Halobacteriales archaeon Cl-PHB]